MTPETIAIIAVGVGLGGLMLTLFQLTNRRIDSLERRMERSLDSIDGRLIRLEQQQSTLAERQSRLEGLMEAIRDMLMRAPATP